MKSSKEKITQTEEEIKSQLKAITDGAIEMAYHKGWMAGYKKAVAQALKTFTGKETA